MRINADKSIGKVLYIVEGSKTEPFLLRKIFNKMLGYQVEADLRNKNYTLYSSLSNRNSRVFVINAEESNIKFIDKDDDFLNNMFEKLITEYDFNIDNAAIFYIFDRDDKSNKDSDFIKNHLAEFSNSRDNGFLRQGMLLLSYPSIESFTLMNFADNSFDVCVDTGNDMKQYLHKQKINQQRINEETLKHAADELMKSLDIINGCNYNLDDMSQCSTDVFSYEENRKSSAGTYNALSLLAISLIDLGIIETE